MQFPGDATGPSVTPSGSSQDMLKKPDVIQLLSLGCNVEVGVYLHIRCHGNRMQYSPSSRSCHGFLAFVPKVSGRSHPTRPANSLPHWARRAHVADEADVADECTAEREENNRVALGVTPEGSVRRRFIPEVDGPATRTRCGSGALSPVRRRWTCPSCRRPACPTGTSPGSPCPTRRSAPMLRRSPRSSRRTPRRWRTVL